MSGQAIVHFHVHDLPVHHLVRCCQIVESDGLRTAWSFLLTSTTAILSPLVREGSRTSAATSSAVRKGSEALTGGYASHHLISVVGEMLVGSPSVGLTAYTSNDPTADEDDQIRLFRSTCVLTDPLVNIKFAWEIRAFRKICRG